MKRRKFIQGTSVGVIAAGLPLESIAAPLPQHHPRRWIIMIDDGRVFPMEASVFRGSPILVPSNELALDNVQWFVPRPSSDIPSWGSGPIAEGMATPPRVHHDLVPFDTQNPGAEVVIGSHDNLILESSRGIHSCQDFLDKGQGRGVKYDAGRIATGVDSLESAFRDWDRDLQQASVDFPGSILDQVILVSRWALTSDVLSWGSYILVDGRIEIGGTDFAYGYQGALGYDWARKVIDTEMEAAKKRWLP
jgi:hypothetical protein